MAQVVMMAVAVLVLLAVGCGSDRSGTRNPVAYIPEEEPPPTLTSEERFLLTPISWPAEFTMPVNDEVEIRFAYSTPPGDHIAPIFVTYLPTSASLQVARDGRVVSIHRELSPDALTAVCAVFSDTAVMNEAHERAAELDTYTVPGTPPLLPPPCGTAAEPLPTPTPAPLTQDELDEFFRQYGHKPNNWPRGYTMVVNEDIEVRFAYPARLADWNASVWIRHLPSASSLAVSKEGFASIDDIGGEEAHEAICELLNDREFVEEITRKARGIDAYTFGQRPLDNLPCESLERKETAGEGADNDDHPLRVVYDRRDWPTDYRL